MEGRAQGVRRLAGLRMLLVVPCGAPGTLQCRSGGLSIGSVILGMGGGVRLERALGGPGVQGRA